MAEMTGGEHLDGRRCARNQPRLGEHVGIDDRVLLEPDELAEVDHDVFMTPVVVEAAELRKPLLEGHLATFEAGGEPDARPRALPLLPSPAGLALSGALTTTDPLARPAAALGRAQLMKFHAAPSDSDASSWSTAIPAGESAGSPLTATRWRTLWIIPRIEGVASGSTV